MAIQDHAVSEFFAQAIPEVVSKANDRRLIGPGTSEFRGGAQADDFQDVLRARSATAFVSSSVHQRLQADAVADK